jgi:RimJ/RimL family protein N-acetyltransferase
MNSSTPVRMQLVLTTPRLVLRPLDLGDVDMLWPDISDAEISRQMAWSAHTEKSQTLEFLRGEVARRESGKGVTWAILRDDAFCGIVSLIGVIRKHRALTFDKAELAYWMSRRVQRQGLMTEACRRVLRFAFGEFGLHKVFVGHFAANAASQALIRRLGFRYIGEQVEDFMKDGVWYDQKLYELIARDYLASVARE